MGQQSMVPLTLVLLHCPQVTSAVDGGAENAAEASLPTIAGKVYVFHVGWHLPHRDIRNKILFFVIGLSPKGRVLRGTQKVIRI